MNKDYNFEHLALEADSRPILEGAVILRRLGGKLLEQLLAPAPPANRRAPVLNELITPQEARRLGELYTWKTRKIIPMQEQRDKKKSPHPTLRDLIIRTIKTEVPAREWQTLFHQRLLPAFGGGVPGTGLPEPMEGLMEKLAFYHPRFRKRMAELVIRYLWNRVLLTPGEPCVPVFAVETFRALIGLTQIQRRGRQRRFIDTVARFRAEARQGIMKEHWAGFWDQWLIKQASLYWALSFDRRNDTFCQSLMSLPILTKIQPEQADATPYKQKKKRKQKPQKTINLSHPDWYTQVPTFFAPQIILPPSPR